MKVAGIVIELPKTWQWANCSEVIDVRDGTHETPKYVSEGYPLVTSKNLKPDGIDFSTISYISEKDHLEISKRSRVDRNDILFAMIGTIGNPVLVDIDTEFSIKNVALFKFANSPIDPRYFRYLLKTRIIERQLDFEERGGTQKFVSLKVLRNMKIPYPPLEEQRRIAAILDKADGVRRKRQEAIRLTEELLKSTFLEMFGDPVTNPKGWRKISLGELLAEPLQNGAYFPKERYVEAPDGVEMVHMSDAFYNFVERGNLKRVQVTSEEFEKYKLIPNDVLIARRSLNYEGSAKPCLISETAQPLIFESSLIRVRLNAEVIDSFFFFSYMLEPRARSAYVFPNVTKSTISGINQAGLKRISVLAPPMSIQKKYRDIYETILGTQSNYQKDYENIDNLFNSLLQRAFRGEL
jgi:type I restriction enzyme S subunit